jgi:hypothetical protein
MQGFILEAISKMHLSDHDQPGGMQCGSHAHLSRQDAAPTDKFAENYECAL